LPPLPSPPPRSTLFPYTTLFRSSEAFLANLVEAVAGTRTLVVVSFRPEYDAAWMRRSYYQRLALPPLGPEAIAELLADLLGTDPSLAGLDERIRTRPAGTRSSSRRSCRRWWRRGASPAR